MQFTILGCGSSGGVPRVGQGWGECDPRNPKNRRRRCSLLVERIGPHGRTTVLVDTSPDLREQLLGANIAKLDGILFTHDHADHTHGLDDVRPLTLAQRKRIDVYLDEQTSRILNTRFSYCFHTPPGSEYPPIVTEHRILAGKKVTIEGKGGAIEALPLLHEHGNITALGFRFGGLVYSPDVNGFPAETLPALEGLDVWILDALRYRPHPSHFSVEESLRWLSLMKPKRGVLTNLHSDVDFETLRGKLPANVEPAYDGLKIELPQ
jgi:phosphoribosyl 1,2-cyclic phosphate phosphodiesterase